MCPFACRLAHRGECFTVLNTTDSGMSQWHPSMSFCMVSPWMPRSRPSRRRRPWATLRTPCQPRSCRPTLPKSPAPCAPSSTKSPTSNSPTPPDCWASRDCRPPSRTWPCPSSREERQEVDPAARARLPSLRPLEHLTPRWSPAQPARGRRAGWKSLSPAERAGAWEGRVAAGCGGLVNKPSRGWLHSSEKISGPGVTYVVKVRSKCLLRFPCCFPSMCRYRGIMCTIWNNAGGQWLETAPLHSQVTTKAQNVPPHTVPCLHAVCFLWVLHACGGGRYEANRIFYYS